jgi:hypothetical protein
MRKWFLLFALAALLIPTLAMAHSAFDGTWKIDINKVGFPKKPDEYLLQNGMYECKTSSKSAASFELLNYYKKSLLRTTEDLFHSRQPSQERNHWLFLRSTPVASTLHRVDPA